MKYKISDSKEDCIFYKGYELHRIIALETLGEVKCGDKGGYIENEGNLSHNGRAWVFDDAKVYGNAIVRDNAQVVNDSEVFGHAIVFGNSMVADFANVFGFAIVSDDSKVIDYANVTGNANVRCNAFIADHAIVRGNALILDHAVVRGNALVSEQSIVTGVAEVSGPARLIGNAIVRFKSDYIVFKNWWSSGRYFTWTRSNNMYKVGCFYGSGEDLINKAYSDSKESGDNYKAIVDYVNNVVLNKK